MKKHVIFFCFTLLVLLDQLTKYITKNADYGIINSTTNTGGVFGVLQGYNTIFIILSIIFLILIWKYYAKEYSIPLCLITAGITGNLIDRIFYNHVRDFIDLKFWPVFNLADSYICIGVFLMVTYLWKK